jgi:ketosteroid isomerase-like protein
MNSDTLAVSMMLATVPFLTERQPPVAQALTVHLTPDLARVLTDYEAAWRVGDGAALAGLFAADGCVLPNGEPPVRGRAAIQKYYKGPGGPLVLHAFAFAAEGALGYIIGGFARQKGQVDVGKFTLTLRRGADGRWLIVSDMDNGNRHALMDTAMSDRDSIQAAINDFIAAYNAGDLAGVTAYYGDDLIKIRQGAEPETREETARRVAEVFRIYRSHLEVVTAEIRVAGEMAFVRGTFRVTLTPRSGGDSQQLDRRFLEIWRKEAGRWKVVRTIDNSARVSAN